MVTDLSPVFYTALTVIKVIFRLLFVRILCLISALILNIEVEEKIPLSPLKPYQ